MEQIRVEHISYSYQNQYQKIEAVKDISCGFEAGSLYAIVGESGSEMCIRDRKRSSA